MSIIIEAGAAPLWRRLLWFGAFWAAGVAATGAVAGLLRWVLAA